MCALCQHTIAQKQCRVSTARDGNVEPTPPYTTHYYIPEADQYI